MENKRWKIEIGHETFYKIATNQYVAARVFFVENPRYLDCKYKISEVEDDDIPVEHHIILERLDKMVNEIFEIRKILNKWRKVEVRVPDDGC
jgi:hypothetical protein